MFDTEASTSLYSNATTLHGPLQHHRHQHFASRTASRRSHGVGTNWAGYAAGSVRANVTQHLNRASGRQRRPVADSVGQPQLLLTRSHTVAVASEGALCIGRLRWADALLLVTVVI